jgi:galactokinase
MDRFAGTSVPESVGRAVAAGRKTYGQGWNPDRLAIAPGRVELLGNHLDYNGGPVLAAAIDRFIVVAANATTGQDVVSAVAADVSGEPSETLDPVTLLDWRNPSPPPEVFDYLRGLMAAAPSRPDRSLRLPTEIAIAGDVPIGVGVSSSAALCVALTLALVNEVSPREVVLLAQEAEHRAGTPCGTMDQSASLAGGVIDYDAATLRFERLNPNLHDYVFVVADSGVDRSLSTSSYSQRVAESKEALRLANERLGLTLMNLAELNQEQFADLRRRHVWSDVLARRAQHVVEETFRVAQGRAAMGAADWVGFGRLMTASGRSSATLYEISHPRVEELVADMLAAEGVLGARMMGGGEGGSALALIRRDAVGPLEEILRSGYYHRYGLENRPELIYPCVIAVGAALIEADLLLDEGGRLN